MEDVYKYRDIKLITNERQMQRIAALPTLRSTKRISPHLVIAEVTRKNVLLNKPIIIGMYAHTNCYVYLPTYLPMWERKTDHDSYSSGMCVLDLSKTLMFDFHYNVMKPLFGENSLRVNFTDTGRYMFVYQ